MGKESIHQRLEKILEANGRPKDAFPTDLEWARAIGWDKTCERLGEAERERRLFSRDQVNEFLEGMFEPAAIAESKKVRYTTREVGEDGLIYFYRDGVLVFACTPETEQQINKWANQLTDMRMRTLHPPARKREEDGI